MLPSHSLYAHSSAHTTKDAKHNHHPLPSTFRLRQYSEYITVLLRKGSAAAAARAPPPSPLAIGHMKHA